MATQTQPPSTGTRLSPYRFTVRQFEKMIDAGVFPEGHNVELLAGVLVPMTTNEPHVIAVMVLANWLRALLPDGYYLREEKPARAGRSWRPEPDIAIVRGYLRDNTRRTPDIKQMPILIEVSDSSYDLDRSWKWRRYAASKVPVYGILDLNNRRLEVFTNPTGKGRRAQYELVTTYQKDDEAPIILDGNEIGRLRVKDVLP
ncbi:MAG TPA: Uma2 family endonuclease [Isosphaeraceae bacterium]|nr:Uma2 family endonuclease [Isosphaeraceae bacterium]